MFANANRWRKTSGRMGAWHCYDMHIDVTIPMQTGMHMDIRTDIVLACTLMCVLTCMRPSLTGPWTFYKFA